MRLFIGIPMAASMAADLVALTERLRSATEGLRWSRPESWHITLQFLGETGRTQCDCVAARLREVRLRAIPVSIDALNVFDRAGVFIAGVRPAAELLEAQRQVSGATAHCGFRPSDRPYQAHITLARSKDRDGGRSLRSLQASLRTTPRLTSFVAGEILLYESFLGPGGSRYEVRGRFPLNAE